MASALITAWNLFTPIQRNLDSRRTTGMKSQMHIVALENNQGEIYCGNSVGKLYLSEDNGATWLSKGANLPVSFGVASIGFYQSQLLVGGIDGTLLSSSNQGTTWTTLFNTQSAIIKILVDGTDIFIGTIKRGVYKSSDGGA